MTSMVRETRTSTSFHFEPTGGYWAGMPCSNSIGGNQTIVQAGHRPQGPGRTKKGKPEKKKPPEGGLLGAIPKGGRVDGSGGVNAFSALPGRLYVARAGLLL